MINLIRNEIFCFLKRHYRIYLVFLILLLGIIIYAFFFYEDSPEEGSGIKIGIINEDGSPYSEMLLDFLTENKAAVKYAQIKQGKREEIEKEFKEGRLDACLIIPPDFIENMSRLENSAIRAEISEENSTISLVLTQALRQYEKYIRAVELNCQALYEKMILDGYNDAEAWEANEKLLLNLILLIINRSEMFEYTEIKDLQAVSVKEYYVYALLSLIILYGGLFPCYNIIRTKEKGLLERNLFHMTRGSYFLGMSLSGIITGLLFIWPVFPLGKLLGLSLYKIGVFFLLYGIFAAILQAAVFMTLFSMSVESVKKTLSTLVVLLFFFFLAGGGLIPITYLPENFLYLSKCTPVYWLMMLFCCLG